MKNILGFNSSYFYFSKDSLGYIKQLRTEVVFVDEIPRISVGKIDRKYFKQLVKEEVIRNNECTT